MCDKCKLIANHIEKSLWFVDSNGKVVHLNEVNNYRILNPVVEILSSPDGDGGAYVIDSYVLHRGDPEYHFVEKKKIKNESNKGIMCGCGKPAIAKSMCKKCYNKNNWALNKAKRGIKDRNFQAGKKCKCGRDAHAKDMCATCYHKKYINEKFPNRRRRTINGLCSCGDKASSNGMCVKCYNKNYYMNKTKPKRILERKRKSST